MIPARGGRAGAVCRGLWVLGGLAWLGGCAAGTGFTEQDRATVAGLGADAGVLARDLRALRGELAELRRQAEADRAEAEAGAREREERMEGEAAGLHQRLRLVEGRLERLAGVVEGLAEQLARRGGAGAGSPAAPAAGGSSASPEELFDRAMESLRAGELGQAVLDLEDLVARHPAHPLAASARFWTGEAYFRARDYQRAVSEYRAAAEATPAGEKTPEALFKLGLAYRALRREDRAREAWSRLIREFPDTEAAQRGRAAAREPPRSGRPPALLEPR